MNLKILERMVLDIIRIIEHNTYENKLIIMIKNPQALKGEKGHQKGGQGSTNWKASKG